MKAKRAQTRIEEVINTITHLVGVVLVLVAIPFLVYNSFQEQDFLMMLSVLAFGVGMLMVYTFSSLYHAVRPSRLKEILNKMDHISIFFLIAGTYTPLVYRYTPSRTAIVFLSVMWGIVLLGIFYKLFFMKRRWLSMVFYLLMGWMLIFIIKPMVANMPLDVLLWIGAGGLTYSIGVVFYAFSKVKYFHNIWHGFVMAGTAFHFIAVLISI